MVQRSRVERTIVLPSPTNEAEKPRVLRSASFASPARTGKPDGN